MVTGSVGNETPHWMRQKGVAAPQTRGQYAFGSIECDFVDCHDVRLPILMAYVTGVLHVTKVYYIRASAHE